MNLVDIIKVDKRIKKMYQYLVDLMTEKGLYDNSLDFQILNTTGLIIQYEKLITALLSEDVFVINSVGGGGTAKKKNPILSDMVNCSESLRKNLKELGLSLDSKVSGISDNDPLSQLMNKMNNL